jgi:hypothetical protein
MGKSLITNLKDPLSITLFLVGQMVDALKLADSSTGDLAKSFNKSYSEASSIRQELNNVANLSMDAAVTTQGLQESMVAVGAALGSNARLNEKDLVTMTKLTKQAGYTHDELMGIQKISLVNGKTLEDNTAKILGSAKAYAAQNKLVINEKEVLREVNKASASLKLSLGLSVDVLAEAVVKSKQFGLNLEQAEKIASSLLEFESSITSELEAELLVGRSFNFERARALALEGKVADAAAEVAKQVGSAKDFGELNVIQQEAIAKSIGMQRDELAQSLIDKEALAKLSAKEGESAQAAFNRLVQEVGMEEAKKRLGDKQLATQFEQQSIQDRFNQSVEKLKEIFVSLADPILQIISPLADLASAILPAINFILTPISLAFQGIAGFINGSVGKLSTMQKVLGGIATIVIGIVSMYKIWNAVESAILVKKRLSSIMEKQGKSMSLFQAIAAITKGAWSSLGPIPFIGAGLAIAAIIGAVASLNSAASKAGDVMSPAKGKTQISTKEGGLFELSQNDDVIAAPGLLSKNQGSSTPMINMQPVIDRLAAVEDVLVQILNKDTNVYMDSTKVGTALNVGTVRIQ